MSEITENAPVVPPPAAGKRKRTGKQREERKRAAEQAKLDAESSGQVVQSGEAVSTDVVDKEEAAAPGVELETGANETAAQPEVEAAPVLDLQKVAGRIPQSLKTLHPVLKKAKTVETQRLIKKIKQLRTKTPDSTELPGLEEQLELLHHIPLNIIAHSFLAIKLKKHHLLKAVTLPEDFMPLAPPSPPSSSKHAPSSPLYVKVENRILSSKGVGEAVKAIVSWTVGEEGATLRSVAGGALKKKVVPKPDLDALQKMRLESMASLPDMVDDVDDEEDVPVTLGGDDGDESDTFEGFNEDEAADAAGWESGSVSGGDDDEEYASGSEGGSNADDRPTKRAKPAPIAAPKTKAKPAPRAPPVSNNTTITGSTFLPTLATGFYAGDSDDSDPDDDAGLEGVIGSAKGERKNRRGQRARKAIWEKKYGRGAKHLVKAREEEQAIADAKNRARGGGSGWGARGGGRGGAMSVSHNAEGTSAGAPGDVSARGGRGGFRGGRGGFAGRGGHIPSSEPVAAHAPASQPAPASRPPVQGAFGKQATEKVHPSWEAAKLRKQKEMAMAIPPPGTTTAKKIVFD